MSIKQITAVVGFHGVPDGDVVKRGVNVCTNLTGNSHFTNPPIDLTVLKAALDRLVALIAQALDGSKQVIAEKNKVRLTVIQMLRILARYVEMTSNGDTAVFQSSGFEAASRAKAINTPLSEKIRKLDRGDNSGEILAWIRPVRGASSYEFRYGPSVNGAAPAAWTTLSITHVKEPVSITGLTAGSIYMFQARSLARNKFSEWSDPVTLMST